MMPTIDIVISFGVSLIAGLIVGRSIGSREKGYSVKQEAYGKIEAYDKIIGHLDKGKPIPKTKMIPELRKAAALAELHGNDEVKNISSDIIKRLESEPFPLVELQGLIDNELIPAMKRDLSRPWWKF